MALTSLSPLTLGTGFILLAVLGIFVSRQGSWSRRIPGPRLAKFTKLWYLWQIYRCDFHWTNINLHRERGKIVQLAPGYFSIDDPDALKTIYGHGTQWVKGEWYDAWNFGPHPDQTNLFSERNPAQHSVMRRKVASMYSMSALVSYEPYVDDCIHLLRGHFARFASTNATVDLAHWLQCYAFDVIGEITFGERFGFLNTGDDVNNLIKTLDTGLSFSSFLGVFIGLRPFQMLLRIVSDTQDGSAIQKFADSRIAITRSQKLDLPEDGPIYMAKKFIHAQQKDHGAKTFTDWDVATNAGANVGADADEYRPERWLEASATDGDDGEKSKAIEQSFMPFGAGSRTCIGKNISLLEINKLIPILVRDYDIEFLTKDGEPQRSKYMPGRNRWFVKPDNLYARITRRT